MYRPNYLCDLHTHSVRSDGNDTVGELIDNAAALGMEVIALTDHDVRPPETIETDAGSISPREYARQKDICFIPGIEYSCDTYVDDVHIVGLGCDFTHPGLLDIERAMEKSKMTGYRRLTEVLCENGIHVSWDDVLAGGGRHRPEEVQRKHIFEAIAAKGYSRHVGGSQADGTRQPQIQRAPREDRPGSGHPRRPCRRGRRNTRASISHRRAHPHGGRARPDARCVH